jgi:Peptidase A4 family
MSSRIDLPRGISVRTFTQPPAGFNPLSADDRKLAVYGFPRRPTEDRRLMERWQAAMSRSLRLIRPQFRLRNRRRVDLPKPVRMAQHTIGTNIWSGVLVDAPAGDAFSWIEGTWIVPNTYPPGGAMNGSWYTASTWLGIDGLHGTMDVLQAGCDSDVLAQSSLKREINVWWEWFPGDSYWIHNLPVAAGDTITCVICTDAASATSATIFFHNVTSGLGASFAVTAPSGFTLTGNCAEWIVEQIPMNGDPPELARYGETYFDEAVAGTAQGKLIDAGSGEIVQMMGAGNEVISSGRIENARVVQVKCLGT